MPDRPDYVTLTRGQLAVLDRVNAGDSGLSVLQQMVRLAQDTLGALGAGFAEYAAGHGRIVAATGDCEPAIGRRVEHTDDLGSVNKAFARQIENGDLRHMLGARCELNGTVVGSLHVHFGDHEPAGPEHHAVLELLAGYAGRLYGAHAGLPVHPAPAPDQDRRQEDRDLWVAVTSHELRTPVTVIKGYADTLTNHWETLGEPGRREAVRVVGTRAAELARLLDRLLTAATDDGSAGAPAAGPFDLAEALREAAGELPGALRQRIHFGELPGGLPKAYGNRDSIATILTELATNAERNSGPDTPIEVCAGTDDDTLRFRVSDRGVGIAPEHVERAFERYWQAGTGDQRPHGAGLGLYLVRRLVERQSGWVSLRPREGGGTVAEVRLPRS
ncbi:sensor histidine kinase KdpD [Actinoplanes sp. DH11]|uniref:sensor histidine kinase n=1 Tax=Actinoplanes sp. DH11 TaxID=2857011 RepID=UPI001E5E3970|nr:HAMP domain-containing sensor histidine kinase [Actinoplanes sp. DH11]